MTTCVHPFNTFPGFPGAPMNLPYPTGGASGMQWHGGAMPAFGQPAPMFNPYAATGFAAAPWSNTYPSFAAAPSNTHGFNPCAPAFGFTPGWNPWTPFNTFAPPMWNATPSFYQPSHSAWNSTPVPSFAAAPFFPPHNAFTPPTPAFGGLPSFTGAPFVGAYTTPSPQAFTNPFVTAWPGVASIFNTLCQPSNWAPATTNANPWNAFAPSPWSNTTPGFATPFAATPFASATFAPSAFGTSGVPSWFQNPGSFTGFNGGPAHNPAFTAPWAAPFNAFNPAAFAPGFTGQPSYSPPHVFTPGPAPAYASATGAGAFNTTRVNPQHNGDAAYRNAA